ncbi:MAG TPA: BON domain-containing protein [Thermoanaerobaculia bacterium]|jgi:hypothetical protein|nr:BON domain-containing protein [Thermoanaerobaculia bacterium]
MAPHDDNRGFEGRGWNDREWDELSADELVDDVAETAAGGSLHRRPAELGDAPADDESGHSWAQYFHEPVREPYGNPAGTGNFPPYGGRRFAYGRESSARKSYGELYGYAERGFGHRRDSFYAAADATPWWEKPIRDDEQPVSGSAAGGSAAGGGPRGSKRSEARIEEEVVQRLEADWIDAADVEVEVADGVVTLAGEVETREERRGAEEIAAEVAGVVDVINRLRARQQGRRPPS